jgi:hypothetical protein
MAFHGPAPACASGWRSYRPRRPPQSIERCGPLEEAVIPPRIRKLVGAVLLLVLVAVWSLLAMAFAQFVAVRSSPLLEFVYYVVAGIGWALPAMPLISWMARRRPTDGSR